MFTKKNFFLTTLIIFVSLILSVYLYELYLIFKIPKELDTQNKIKYELYNKKFNKKFDKRTKKDILNDHLKIDKNITLQVPPLTFLKDNNLNFFPLSGISNTQTITCNESGYYAKYFSDRYGFNNPDFEWDQKDIQFLLIGDSYTHGACVNRPNDIGSVLRKLSKKSVINLGYAGNGPLIEFASLREYFPKAKVRNIIWIYLEQNDISNLNNELKNKILKMYLSDDTFSQKLIYKQKNIDEMLNEKISNSFMIKDKKNILIDNVKDFFLLRKLKGTFYENPFEKDIKLEEEIENYKLNYNYKKFQEILKKTKKIADKKNSKLYFVYLPDYFRFTEKYNQYSYFFIKKIVNDLNIKFIDIKEYMENQNDPLNFYPFRNQGHFTIEGYKKISNEIFKYVKNN